MFKLLSTLFIILTIQMATASSFDHTHKDWTKVLSLIVKEEKFSSSVNYKLVKSNPKLFNSYLTTLEKVTKTDYDKFSKDQQLSFLINAYNAFTVKLIIDNYPVKSIKDIGSLFSSPWKKKFFKLFGKETHLNNIEHDMIRVWFDEPRIHFAVVCASIGCPALKAQAFIDSKLDKQLEESAIKFLSDKSRNRYSVKDNQLELSKIFKWYGDDFKSKYGSFQSYISAYITSNKQSQSLISSKKASIDFLDYDWNLNKQ